jgi:hypothetical protein
VYPSYRKKLKNSKEFDWPEKITAGGSSRALHSGGAGAASAEKLEGPANS